MDMLFARQPIFSIDNKVIGYEFLYRNEVQNDKSTNLEKTIDVLTNTSTFFSNFDSEMMSKKIFLNFDRSLLLDNIVDVLSPRDHVLEILETVEEDKITINRIIQLKRLGFKFAIDDYTYHYKNEVFVDLADFIKVDFLSNSVEQLIEISKREKLKKKILLAEKVENEQMHQIAVALNYKLFQGYHYVKPIVHKGNYISINIKTCIEVIRKINTPEKDENGNKIVDLNNIAKYIERDPVLTFKILQIANAARMNLYVKIDSVLRAVTLLGYRKLNKWLKILLFQEIKTRKKSNDSINQEVIKTIVIRTAFVENILAQNKKLKEFLGESVLVSMVDLFDILFDMSMSEIITSLDLSDEISDALLDKKNENTIAFILNLVRSYEEGKWEDVRFYCELLDIDFTRLGSKYSSAIEDSGDIIQELNKNQ